MSGARWSCLVGCPLLDWYRIETERAYLRPEDEVTGNRPTIATAPCRPGRHVEGVRYQMYEASDGHVLFAATGRPTGRTLPGRRPHGSLRGVPGAKYADHAKGNVELQRELQAVFEAKTCRVAWPSPRSGSPRSPGQHHQEHRRRSALQGSDGLLPGRRPRM